MTDPVDPFDLGLSIEAVETYAEAWVAANTQTNLTTSDQVK